MFKKLHCFTVKLYAKPLPMALAGIVRRAELWSLVSRSCCRAEVTSEGARESTSTVRPAQGLPPLPDELDRSRVRESHSPTLLGADRTTVGATAETELWMVTVTAVEEVGQLDKLSQLLPEHSALTEAVLARDTGEYIAAQPVVLLT